MASTVCFRPGASSIGKTARKNFPAKIPYNPLKRLDSDERIQGNTRKSNTQNRGFCRETVGRQENPSGRAGWLAVRLQPIGIGVSGALRVRDHVLSIFARVDPLRSDRRLAMAPRDVEHVGR